MSFVPVRHPNVGRRAGATVLASGGPLEVGVDTASLVAPVERGAEHVALA
jgi:hypothetical protein